MAVIRLVSWNMARCRAAWAGLDGHGADVALLQEAGRPGPTWEFSVAADATDRWETALVGGRGPWRTAVVRLSDQVELRARTNVTLEASTSSDDWVVSRAGSIAAADVVTDGEVAVTAVSVYAAWEMAASRGYADAGRRIRPSTW